MPFSELKPIVACSHCQRCLEDKQSLVKKCLFDINRNFLSSLLNLDRYRGENKYGVSSTKNLGTTKRWH